jgi:hypothetical protein
MDYMSSFIMPVKIDQKNVKLVYKVPNTISDADFIKIVDTNKYTAEQYKKISDCPRLALLFAIFVIKRSDCIIRLSILPDQEANKCYEMFSRL